MKAEALAKAEIRNPKSDLPAEVLLRSTLSMDLFFYNHGAD
jgi:hypothetical protein